MRVQERPALTSLGYWSWFAVIVMAVVFAIGGGLLIGWMTL